MRSTVSELIGMDPGSREVGEYAGEINASGKNLQRLLDNMLQMVEIGSGKAYTSLFPMPATNCSRLSCANIVRRPARAVSN